MSIEGEEKRTFSCLSGKDVKIVYAEREGGEPWVVKRTIVHANAYFVVMRDESGKIHFVSTNHMVRISELAQIKERLKEAQVIL